MPRFCPEASRGGRVLPGEQEASVRPFSWCVAEGRAASFSTASANVAVVGTSHSAFSVSITGGRRPVSRSAGVSGVLGNGGSGEREQLSLQDVAELIRAGACPRVLVMVGAGISTPSGIPDFRCPAGPRHPATPPPALCRGAQGLPLLRRSPGSGCYSNLQQYDIPYPEAIFELPFFFHNPKPFLALAKKLYPGHYRPNVIHYFLRLLHDKGLLLRLYTQNIDGLERGEPACPLPSPCGGCGLRTAASRLSRDPGDWS